MMSAIDHHKGGCPTDTSMTAAGGPPGIGSDHPSLADERVCSRIRRKDGQLGAALGSEVSAALRKPLNVLGQSGNSLHVDGSDELVAHMAASIDAGDQQQVLALARELVAASHAQDGDDEELLPLPVVARKLDCGTRTVWRLIARMELAAPVHVGGCAKWFRQDVREYLDRIRAGRGKGCR